MTPIASIFRTLEGQWKLFRSIPGHGKIEGIAKFKKIEGAPDMLHYREDGQFLSVEGDNFKIFREYFYRFQDEKISVFFAENPQRLMHTLEIASPSSSSSSVTAKARHLCSCDIYDATYEFRLPSEFSLCYTITGPNKNYSISTVFKRFIT